MNVNAFQDNVDIPINRLIMSQVSITDTVVQVEPLNELRNTNERNLVQNVETSEETDAVFIDENISTLNEIDNIEINNVEGENEPCVTEVKETSSPLIEGSVTPDDEAGIKETREEILKPPVEVIVEKVEYLDGESSNAVNQIEATLNQSCTDKHRIMLSTGQCLTVPGRIRDVRINFLIDTGAAVSVLNVNVWESLRRYAQFQRIGLVPSTAMQTVNGEPLTVRGKINVPIELADVIFPFEVNIIEGVTYDAILGKDFLEYYKSCINLSEKTLELRRDQPSRLAGVQTKEGTCTENLYHSFNIRKDFRGLCRR